MLPALCLAVAPRHFVGRTAAVLFSHQTLVAAPVIFCPCKISGNFVALLEKLDDKFFVTCNHCCADCGPWGDKVSVTPDRSFNCVKKIWYDTIFGCWYTITAKMFHNEAVPMLHGHVVTTGIEL